jgi:hypothetical protein
MHREYHHVVRGIAFRQPDALKISLIYFKNAQVPPGNSETRQHEALAILGKIVDVKGFVRSLMK